MKWHKENFLLQWYPSRNEEINQIIIAPGRNYNTEILPSPTKNMIGKTSFTNTFS